MKKSIAAILAFVLIAMLSITALAAPSGDKPEPDKPDSGAKAETNQAEVKKNRFSLSRVVRQEEAVTGDFIALGEDAEVSKGVGGDVYTIGRNVVVTDTKGINNIAVAGANVHINVKSARNIYAAGVDLNVHAEKSDGMYLTGLGVTLSGETGDAVIAAGSVHLDGSVSGDLSIRSDNIIFGDDATVNGKVTIYSKKHPNLPASLDDSRVTYKSASDFTRRNDESGARLSGIRRIALIVTVSGVVAAIIISLIINAYRPEFYKYKAMTMKSKFWVDLLRGLAAAIVIPVVGIALLFTYVGVPIGVILLVGCAALMYLAPIVTALTISRAVFKRMNRFASGAICVFILYGLMLIPYAGFIIGFVSILYGLGAAVGSIKLRTRETHYPDKLSPAVI